MARRAASVFTCSLVLACVGPGGVSTTDADDEVGEADTGDSTDDGDATESGDDSDPTDTGDETDESGDEVCRTPLPPEAGNPDNQLAFGLFFGGLEQAIGTSRQFQVGLIQCCVFWEPIPTCSEYTVEPEGIGATIDPESGVLMLADDVPDGSVFTVTANIEDGLATVQDTLFAYRPELHPLKGFWHEVARIPCGGGPEFVPSDPIGELYFTASGQAGVTWNPFEAYVDYTGDYVADLDAGTLSISGIGGNYVPDDVDGEGLFAFEGEELVLEDMWLGSSQESADPPACGHRFAQ
jgi:hypothetical protein